MLMTLLALVGGRFNDLQVCVTASRKRSYLLIVMGFFKFITENNFVFIKRSR